MLEIKTAGEPLGELFMPPDVDAAREFFRQKSRVVGAIVKGWQISGITQFRSGRPLGTIGAACNLPSAGTCYADCAPDNNARCAAGYHCYSIDSHCYSDGNANPGADHPHCTWLQTARTAHSGPRVERCDFKQR